MTTSFSLFAVCKLSPKRLFLLSSMKIVSIIHDQFIAHHLLLISTNDRKWFMNDRQINFSFSVINWQKNFYQKISQKKFSVSFLFLLCQVERKKWKIIAMGNHMIFFNKSLDSIQFLSWNKEQLKLFYHSLLHPLVIAGFSLSTILRLGIGLRDCFCLLPFYCQKKRFDKPEKKAICAVENWTIF